MTEIHSIDLFTDLEQQIQNKIERQKEGKREVSDTQFFTLFTALVVIVGVLALQNGMYGYSQGSTIGAMVLLGVLYFTGDVALAALTSLETRKATVGVLTFFTKAGLIALSLVSGLSFMLSEQSSNDRNNSRISSLESQIVTNESAFRQYGKTVTADRLMELNRQLDRERARVGADHAASNAIYSYISNYTGYSFEVVSFSIRAFWVAIFIFTGMCLSALMGLLWCPFKEARAFKGALKEQRRTMARQRAQLRIVQARSQLEAEREAISAGGSVARKKPSHSRSQERAPTQDTATNGQTVHRYQEVRERILGGSLKPSVSAVRKGAGCGTATAISYLKQLNSEGVLTFTGNRYVVTQ
jgi:hypothetical protein